MEVYNIDLTVKGECLEMETLYFNESTKRFIIKQWCENNIFLLFQRMRNNYLEVIKYLEHHNKSEDIDLNLLISEITNRVKDCDFYQENLVKSYKEEGFSAFFTNEFYRLEQENEIVLNIDKKIFPQTKS